jgi:hypothetical protein
LQPEVNPVSRTCQLQDGEVLLVLRLYIVAAALPATMCPWPKPLLLLLLLLR